MHQDPGTDSCSISNRDEQEQGEPDSGSGNGSVPDRTNWPVHQAARGGNEADSRLVPIIPRDYFEAKHKLSREVCMVRKRCSII